MTTTVDQQGSVPLPEQVLRESGVLPGDQLDVYSEGDDIILRKPVHALQESLIDILRGLEGLPLAERSR